MGVIYDDFTNYEFYKNKYSKYSFVEESITKYTVQIKMGGKKIILSKKETINKTNILNLISKVKKDGIKFVEGGKHQKTTTSKDIFWSYFNTNFGELDEVIEVGKIDLNSAYWTKAINLGVLSYETVDYFESICFSCVDEKKQARLKALGSYATIKTIKIYEYGVEKEDLTDEEKIKVDKKLRNLYLYICELVSEDMLTIMEYVGAYYYYWDCVFVPIDKIEETKVIMKKLGYDFKVEKDEARIFYNGVTGIFQNYSKRKNKTIDYNINN